MNSRKILMVSLLLASTTALAQTTTLKSVVVRASSAETVEVSCSSPELSVQDTDRVLAINDSTKSAGLRKRIIKAATEACQAGIASIEVERGSDGRSLTWKAAE